MTRSSRSLLTTAVSRRGVLGLFSVALGAFAGVFLPRDGGGGAAHAAGPAAATWVCTNADCDPYVYDPAKGDADNINNPGHPIPPGTSFEDLPDDWICPFCGSGKDWFRRLDG